MVSCKLPAVREEVKDISPESGLSNPLSYDWETEMLNIAQALNPMKNQE